MWGAKRLLPLYILWLSLSAKVKIDYEIGKRGLVLWNSILAYEPTTLVMRLPNANILMHILSGIFFGAWSYDIMQVFFLMHKFKEMTFFRVSPLLSIVMTSKIRVNTFYLTPRDRLYITSEKPWGGWERKIAIFANV